MLRKIGKQRNKANEGITNQNILFESAITLTTSCVSIYSQTIANTETSGIEAKMAASKLLRFASSEINTISNALVVILTR